MKDKWGRNKSAATAIASYVPVRLRCLIIVPVAVPVLLALGIGEFFEEIWRNGLKDAIRQVKRSLYMAFIDVPSDGLKRLWDGDDPLKPSEDEPSGGGANNTRSWGAAIRPLQGT